MYKLSYYKLNILDVPTQNGEAGWEDHFVRAKLLY